MKERTAVSRDPHERAAVLAEALPWLRRWRDAIIVVKYGGSAIGEERVSLEGFAQDIVLLASVGLRPVVVHGGGPQIGNWMKRLGKEPQFIDGMRVTDSDTLDIARMVLVGKVNRDLVGALNLHGPLAVGLSGEDAGLIKAHAKEAGLGFVGDIDSIDTTIIHRLLAENLIPVIATIGSDETGQAYNINADVVAGAIACALRAEKLLYLTDVEGLRTVANDPESVVRSLSVEQVESMISTGAISGGMIPKATSAVYALQEGVKSVTVLDGRVPHVLLLEMLTDSGMGTMIVEDATI